MQYFVLIKIFSTILHYCEGSPFSLCISYWFWELIGGWRRSRCNLVVGSWSPWKVAGLIYWDPYATHVSGGTLNLTAYLTTLYRGHIPPVNRSIFRWVWSVVTTLLWSDALLHRHCETFCYSHIYVIIVTNFIGILTPNMKCAFNMCLFRWYCFTLVMLTFFAQNVLY